jgi:hypothetical protein
MPNTASPTGDYEIEHLIPLSLGGSNSIKNLWPQKHQGLWNSFIKDELQEVLHRLVCAGELIWQPRNTI